MKAGNCGPCGLYCCACRATDCDGCLSDKVDDWVKQCKFRTCAREKHLDFCCHCVDYPCKELETFMSDKWPHHWTMRPNLAYIKDHGVEKRLQAQKRAWSCGSCGARIFWYQKTCSCGAPLDAWELPAQAS
ncbi:MAG: DUF3795 domain-containing protein [Betaproteobacteria bacterium]